MGLITIIVGLALVIVLFYAAYRFVMGQVVREEVAAYGNTQEWAALLSSHDLPAVEKFIRNHETKSPKLAVAEEVAKGIASAGSKSGSDAVGMGDVKMLCLGGLRKHADVLRRDRR